MERFIGTSYPANAGRYGLIEPDSKTIDLNSVDGIYLKYLLAGVSVRYNVVTLRFDMELNPYAVYVETPDGDKNHNWKLQDFNDEDLKDICTELGVDMSKHNRNEIARMLLLTISPNEFVSVPAYKYQTGKV